MWTKDDYQEHMLGYLGDVRAEIEQLTHSSLQLHDLNELRTDLDIALELLWWLIGSSETDWEGFRYSLEAGCDELLSTFSRVLRPDYAITSIYHTVPGNHETRFQSLKTTEWGFLSKAMSGV